MDPTTDPEGFKAATRAQWDRCAAGWDAHGPEIRLWLREATDRMLDEAGVAPGAAVLDVAAGAGDQTLDAAARVGPTGRVLATDLSPALVELAAAAARRAGHANVSARVSDAESLDLEPGSFDAAVCRLGLMLMPAPLRALRGIRAALRPGGRACAVVFGAPRGNPCIGAVVSTALRRAGLPPPDPAAPGTLSSLGAPGRLAALFGEAGFDDVRAGAIDAPFRLPSARHYLDFVRTSASPVRRILAGLAPAEAEAAWAEMEERLRAFETADGWVGPNELAWASGRRPVA